MPIYMKYAGITGMVKTKGEHNGWIELQSAQVGTNYRITNPTGTGGNREGSAPAVNEIVITKMQDDVSTLLFQEAFKGKGKKVTIDFVKTEKGKEVTYMSIELEDVLISNYSVSGHGGDAHGRPAESLSLSSTKITYSVKATASDPPNNADRMSWDLAVGGG
jgi:type VI secretion system secreted protein Hcp